MVKEQISNFIKTYSKEYVGRTAVPAMHDDILEIESFGINGLDAAHIAAAINAECDYFITTDDRILRFRTDKIEMIDPIQFIRETEVNR